MCVITVSQMCKIQPNGTTLALNTRVCLQDRFFAWEVLYIAEVVEISSRVCAACNLFVSDPDVLAFSLKIRLSLAQS